MASNPPAWQPCGNCGMPMQAWYDWQKNCPKCNKELAEEKGAQQDGPRKPSSSPRRPRLL